MVTRQGSGDEREQNLPGARNAWHTLRGAGSSGPCHCHLMGTRHTGMRHQQGLWFANPHSNMYIYRGRIQNRRRQNIPADEKHVIPVKRPCRVVLSSREQLWDGQSVPLGTPVPCAALTGVVPKRAAALNSEMAGLRLQDLSRLLPQTLTLPQIPASRFSLPNGAAASPSSHSSWP